MYFDPERNAYIDEETGQVVYYEDDPNSSSMIRSAMVGASIASPPSTSKRSKKSSKKSRGGNGDSPYHAVDLDAVEVTYDSTYALPPANSSRHGGGSSRHDGAVGREADDFVITNPEEFERMFELAATMRAAGDGGVIGVSGDGIIATGSGGGTGTAASANTHATGGTADSDWNFARTLQLLEFEIANEELAGGQEGDAFDDFTRKEYRASRSCRRQLMTISFFICIVQIALLISMVQTDGWAPSSENPAIGPPVYSMVRYGAKEAALIVYKKEWWRLLSSTMLHAGVWHLIPNVAIQLRVGGYLNLVYGTPYWMWIYFVSGIFGEMMSCVFIPGSVGVGSSGALMGMLSSWVVWIIFRWKKIPPECKSQRNCQLTVVVASIVITLATSMMPRVDWAAHAGGAFMGAIWGFILLSNQLDNDRNQIMAKIGALAVFIATFTYTLYYMIVLMDPPRTYLDYWAMNDDW